MEEKTHRKGLRPPERAKGINMTVKQVCEKYGISPDTLRYYERMGAIPAVNRGKNGIRDYTEQDIGWVENVLCMRNAGVPVEMIAEYVKLCQQGDETFSARYNLLKDARSQILKQLEKYRTELERLEYKISRYEAAVKTGMLEWDEPPGHCPCAGWGNGKASEHSQ